MNKAQDRRDYMREFNYGNANDAYERISRYHLGKLNRHMSALNNIDIDRLTSIATKVGDYTELSLEILQLDPVGWLMSHSEELYQYFHVGEECCTKDEWELYCAMTGVFL